MSKYQKVVKSISYRSNLGTFGRFDTYLFDEEYVIAIPLDEIRTVYLSGKFYSVNDVKSYQKEMKIKVTTYLLL